MSYKKSSLPVSMDSFAFQLRNVLTIDLLRNSVKIFSVYFSLLRNPVEKHKTILTCGRISFIDVRKKGHFGSQAARLKRDQTRFYKCLFLQSGFQKNEVIGKVRF